MEDQPVEAPKEAPKEKIHKSGLPAPSASQQPHHPPTIEPEIVEFDNQPSELNEAGEVKQLPEAADQDFENEPVAAAPVVEEELYERRS